mmetsp:Transcript_36197/g.71172  ORF Transcript_36197/g.71172 Transcript_36197/m.71172 type:complete len:163 (-) Transcript_36197:259-747(-)|eukprot:CAMPEP_0175154506 /NCGR_PEP_ID=MMETSP0087-20121206/20387_1 /TAXON_ID=136419 /ORGANISM="Unknown Unknown, Strain D1" /LENGTH=162 /DNA_ID=CAMNT_0016441417 /DNA_START=30 /DNA_END=518 /DNA_ORIENTATION=+
MIPASSLYRLGRTVGAQTCKQFRVSSSFYSHRRTKKTIVATDKAPAAIGPYSQAVSANGFLFVSGALGLCPKEMEFTSTTDVAEQTRQALVNMGEVLKAGGASYESVVKTTVLLADMADFPAVNAEYTKFFPDNPPARACYACKELPKSALVEIEAVALVDQ